MPTRDENRRFQALLAALREDELDAEGLRELERFVLDDEEALDLYLDATQLRNSLAWQSEHENTSADDEEGCCDPSESSPPIGFLGEAWDRTTDFLSRPFSLSMMVVALTLGSFLTILAFIAAPTATGLLWESADAQPPIAARLNRTVQCLWADADSKVPTGRHVPSGHEIRLRAGLAELEFRDGTLVILEGPVSLRLDSSQRATLHYGRITAKSPPGVTGFRVETPSTTVVDLGTEFGINVDVTGDSTVAVFAGKVNVAQRGTAGARPELLRAGEQVQITKAGRLEDRSRVSGRFVREVPQRSRVRTLAKVDIAPSDESPLQAGFSPFIVGKETIPAGRTVEQQFGQVTVGLRGVDVALKPRYREMLEANGEFDEVPLLADLIFAAEGEAGSTGMDIIIGGLVPGRRHVVTIWSSDVSSEGTRISDWFVHERRVNNDYAFTYEVMPKSNQDRRFSFTAEADAQGTIRIEARRDAASYISENGPQPAVFLNGIQIQEIEPVVDASRPTADEHSTQQP